MKNILLIALLFWVKCSVAQPIKDTATTQTNIILETKTGKIYGSLSVPTNSSKKIPVVFIIAGSGPTDRNCNSILGVKSNSFKMLADSLLQYGIATLRYDKRGVGESIKSVTKEADIRFDDYVNDAVEFIALLKKDKRFSTITVLGHSEGSLVGMIAAKKANANKYISVAGPGMAAYSIIKKQIAAYPKDEVDNWNIALDSLSKGFEVTNLIKSAKTTLRPSVQPYLISWFKYDPTVEIAKLKIPISIIQGSTDIQVGEDDAMFLYKANPKSEYHILKSMSHILKEGPVDKTKNFATYNSPNTPILSSFVQVIVTFVKKK
jgi:uncharacterized protein